MARSDLALDEVRAAYERGRADRARRRVRSAYERTHVLAAARGLVIAAALVVLAIGLHRITQASWLIASLLGASLIALGWRGGAWRRGAFAGVLAGLPPLIAPSLVFALSHGQHCTSCEAVPGWPCLLACFGTSAVLGMLVGHRATTDASPRQFATASIATAALTGLLGCGTTGLGGAAGVVIGLVAGGVTGWVVAGRTAHV
jgi:hypothetical protein